MTYLRDLASQTARDGDWKKRKDPWANVFSLLEQPTQAPYQGLYGDIESFAPAQQPFGRDFGWHSEVTGRDTPTYQPENPFKDALDAAVLATTRIFHSSREGIDVFRLRDPFAIQQFAEATLEQGDRFWRPSETLIKQAGGRTRDFPTSFQSPEEFINQFREQLEFQYNANKSRLPEGQTFEQWVESSGQYLHRTTSGNLPEQRLESQVAIQSELIPRLLGNIERSQDEFKEYVKAHPEFITKPEYERGVTKDPSLLLDPGYWMYEFASTAPYAIAAIGTTLAVTAATGGNLPVGMAAGAAVVTPALTGDMYQTLINEGATPQQATDLASVLGPVSGAIEVIGDFPLLKTLAGPVVSTVKRAFMRTIALQVSKNLITKGVRRFTVIEISETLEEITQEFITNAARKAVNENVSLLENLGEVAARTPIAVAPLAGLGVGGGAIRDTGLAQEIGAGERGAIGPERLPEAQQAIEPTEALAGQPPVTPPLAPPLDITGVPEPKRWSGLIHPLQDVEQLVQKMTNPDFARKVANLPVIKQIMSELNPAAVAHTIPEKFALAQASLYAEIDNKVTTIMSHVARRGNMTHVFGSTDSRGIITKGKLKGVSAYDIVEFPNKYPLTLGQKKYLALSQEIEQAAYQYLVDAGIEVNEAKLLVDQVYASRSVVGRTGPNGEIVELGHIGVGRRIGAKLGTEKSRVFQTVEEAQEAGFRYLSYDAALQAKVQGVLRRVANKQLADWLLTKVEWRSTAADPETVLAAEQASNRYAKARHLDSALNRVVRGERITPQTINSIASVYPEQAAELSALIPLLQANKPVARRVKALTQTARGLVSTEKVNRLQAINARAKSRERNLRATTFEGRIPQPAFMGAVFTGEDAKQMTNQINELLATKNPQVLQKVLAELSKPGMIARFMVLAGDFSPMMIQLLVDLSAHPKQYARAGPAIVQGLADPLFIQNYMASEKAQRVFARLPELITPAGNATEFTEAMGSGGPLAAGPVIRPGAEETLGAALVKTPFRAGRKVARAALVPFQNAFEAVMTVAQVEIADSLLHTAVDQQSASDLAQYVNTLNGMTVSARLGVSQEMRLMETTALLAPRYNRAIAAFIFSAMQGAIGKGGLRGRLSVIAMTKFLAGTAALAVGITLAKGEPPENIVKHLNPTDRDFMNWTFGESRLGIGSKYRSVFSTVGQAWGDPESLLQIGMENPVFRFVRGNLGPVPATALDVLTGNNYMGEPTRDNIWSFGENVILENILPIWVQSTLLEGGDPKNRVIRGFAEFVGARAYPDTVWSEVRSLREKYAQEQFNKPYEELRDAERDDLLREHPDLANLEQEGEMEMAARGGEFAQWRLTATAYATAERNDNLEKYAIALETGQVSKYEYDKNRSRIRAYYSSAQGVIWSAGEILDPKGEKEYLKWLGENQHPDDKAMDAYYTRYSELIDTSELPIDWDEINTKLAQFLKQYSEATREYILEHLDDWIQDLPPAAKRVEQTRLTGIADETWWDGYRDEGVKQPTLPSAPSFRPSGGGGTSDQWQQVFELLNK